VARLRLGVALLVPTPVREEVEGLRRALGDAALGRVPGHLTLVPPVNVRQESLGAALATLRRAAAACPRRLRLELGPVSTFLPDNPVVYLAVTGDLDALGGLRHAVLSGPLERQLSWPFVPHVTLTDQAGADGIPGAVAALSHYRRAVSFEGVHLLQEVGHSSGRHWVPLADACLGPAAVVGRGGLALELARSTMLDPEAAALAAAALAGDTAGGGAACVQAAEAAALVGATFARDTARSRPPVVITGRREQSVVGVAVAWLTDDGGRVAVLVAAAHRGQGIGGHLLAAVEATVAEEGWACSRLSAVGPAGFYRARSRWSVVPARYSKTIDE
jgi:2'-5' RNA ligase/GNAT superfamily N-acetyltransferase